MACSPSFPSLPSQSHPHLPRSFARGHSQPFPAYLVLSDPSACPRPCPAQPFPGIMVAPLSASVPLAHTETSRVAFAVP